ncbi:MAG: hypothetical protein KKE20_01265 [Nanoarchaeota archaeon]|nr:hypothetical protein [Nanoarchaeota archaeon]
MKRTTIILTIILMMFLSVLVVITACSSKPEISEPDNAISDQVQPSVDSENDITVESGAVVEQNYTEVRVRDDDEPVKTSPLDILAKAQAAQDSGENVNIRLVS